MQAETSIQKTFCRTGNVIGGSEQRSVIIAVRLARFLKLLIASGNLLKFRPLPVSNFSLFFNNEKLAFMLTILIEKRMSKRDFF